MRDPILNTRQAVAAARVDAHLKGCTCDVEIKPEEISRDVWYIAVRHDDWCPVLTEGDQTSVIMKPRQGGIA